jgi:hypothetical protein
METEKHGKEGDYDGINGGEESYHFSKGDMKRQSLR